MINNRFTATEWLSGNMHRSYPLDDSVADSCPIPTSLLADMFILVNGAEDHECSFYISEIRTTDTSVVISIAGRIGSTVVESTPVATFATVGADSTIGSISTAALSVGKYSVFTKLIAGDTSVAGDMPSYSEFTEQQSAIFTGCVRGVTDLSDGAFVINGTKVPGVVTISPGSGIDFDVENLRASISVDVSITHPDGSNSKNLITARLVGELTELLDYVGEYDNNSLEIVSLNVDSTGAVSGSAVIGGVTSSLKARMITANGGIIIPDVGDIWYIDPENIKLSDIDTETHLSISAADYDIPADNLTIVSDAQLLQEAVEQYGVPVRSINGVTPDSRGNISIVPDNDTVISSEGSTQEDRLKADFYACVSNVNTAAGLLTIRLSREIPCDSGEAINSLMANIQSLNDRIAALNSFLNRLDAAQSNLALKVAEMTK